MITEEQLVVAQTESDLIVRAIAGSGKTQALMEHAILHPTARKILICFNKDAAMSATERSRMLGIQNLECSTAHSLAYRNMRVREVKNAWTLEEILDLHNEKDTRANRFRAALARKALNTFCHISEKDINRIAERFLENSEYGIRPFISTHFDYIQSTAKEMWMKMANGQVPMTHDFYLKAWSLRTPDLYKDFIYSDESQDCDPPMLHVIENQKCPRIVVGDEFQQIYLWRGAQDAMNHFNGWPETSLTESFRFGPLIASEAVDVLREYRLFNSKISLPTIQGRGSGPKNDGSHCYIARTNSGVLGAAVEIIREQLQTGKTYPIRITGSSTKLGPILFTQDSVGVYDILALMSSKPDKVRAPTLKNIKTFKEVIDYAEGTGDTELKSLINICRKYGTELYSFIPKIESILTTSHEKNIVTLSTAHKAKGMEWDTVTILDDFMVGDRLIKELNKMKKPDYQGEHTKSTLAQEVNLKYVAITRARDTVHLEEGGSVTG